MFIIYKLLHNSTIPNEVEYFLGHKFDYCKLQIRSSLFYNQLPYV
jgi:hypothetical protein